jgi:hypothetical protein
VTIVYIENPRRIYVSMMTGNKKKGKNPRMT